MVKANVDRILELLNDKKSLSTSDLARLLAISGDDVLKSAEYLEQDGVVKIERKFPKTVVTLIKTNIPSPPQLNQQAQSTQRLPPPPSPSSLSSPPPPPSPQQVVNVTPNQQTQPPLPIGSDLFTIETTTKTTTISAAPSVDLTKTAPSFDRDAFSSPNIPLQQEIKKDINAQTFFEQASFNPSKPLIDENPLETQPHFSLDAPSPVQGNVTKPVFSYSNEFKPEIKTNYPGYVKTDMERIEFMLDEVEDKLIKNDYNDLNIYYRNIYNLFKNSDNLTPNERYILSERINDMFEKIKRVYVIEHAI